MLLLCKGGSTCSGQTGERVASGAEWGEVGYHAGKAFTSMFFFDQYDSTLRRCKEEYRIYSCVYALPYLKEHNLISSENRSVVYYWTIN